MVPKHFHRRYQKRLDTPVSARRFRAKLKITFALLIAQMERDHGLGLAMRPAAPQNSTNSAIGNACDDAKNQQYPYEFKGVYDQVPDIVPGCRYALAPGDGRLVPDLGQQPFRVVRAAWRQDHGHQRAGPFGHGAGNPLEIHKTFTGDLRGWVGEDGQPHFPAWSPKPAQLRFSA